MIDSGDSSSLISYAAALSKTLSSHKTSSLTYGEWESAYSIAKNEPSEKVKKTTTGVDLPATEKEKTQDTGVLSKKQGSHSVGFTEENRAKGEKWNPVSNFEHYSQNRWSHWMSSGLVNYTQKTDDASPGIAKKVKPLVLNQDKKFKSTFPM